MCPMPRPTIEHPDLNYVAVCPDHSEYDIAEKRHLPPDQGGCEGHDTTPLRAGWRTVGPMGAKVLALFEPCLHCLRRLESNIEH
jgi:hypothetical protein